METETYTDVEVELQIGFDEIEALIQDGEILAHPDDAPDLGIIYDQHERARFVVPEYQESSEAEPFVLSERDLIDVINGEPAEWTDGHPADVDVIMYFEADRDDGDGPQLGPSDLERWS